MLTHAISVADSVVVFRDGSLYLQDLPKDHIADINSSLHTTNTYNFAFRVSTGTHKDFATIFGGNSMSD